MTGYQSKKLMAQSREDDLVKRLRELAGRYDEAAECIEELDKRNKELEAALRKINSRLSDDDSWLAQSIDCRNIAETALGEKKDER